MSLKTRTLGRALGVLALATTALEGPRTAAADWFDEEFEVHGFARSTAHFNSPDLDFGEAIQLNSFRNELNLETQMGIYRGEELSVTLFGVFRPTYDAVYDLYPDTFGKRARTGASGTQLGANLLGAEVTGVNPSDLRDGKSAAGAGAGIDGVFRYSNADIQFLFTGRNAPAFSIDNRVFYGNTVAPATPRGSRQGRVGGSPRLDNFTRGTFMVGGAPGVQFPALQGSINAAQAAGRDITAPLFSPAQTELYGDRGSFKQLPFDVNATEGELQFDCFDNAHPACFVREFYFEAEYGNTLARFGKQQIVWGKTDAFRLQDIVNPIDLGQRSIFDPLEDRRIPTLAVDIIQTFGDVGPFQDFSAELVWVVDRFSPVQLGQCGDPQAFIAACEGRVDIAAYGTVGLSAAEADERDWQLRNTEPGFRFEFRIPEPSLAFSLSGFWGFQDEPVLRLKNQYGINNPNPAGLLFLQKNGAADAIAGQLNAIAPGLAGVLAPRFTGGFDPYNQSEILAAGAEVANLYGLFFGPSGLLCPDTGNAGTKAACISASGAQVLNFPFVGGPVILEYPRVFTLGASADYQIPGADGILRLETAYDFDRHITDSGEFDLNDSSNVIRGAVGVDFNPFIPFINSARTSFLSGQIFVEHIIDYSDDGNGRRMIPDETQMIATLFMQNFFRNDSITLTNFVAWDVNARAIATGPSIKWVLTNELFVEFGAQMVWGSRTRRPVRNLCEGGPLTEACLGNIANQQAGNFQGLNDNFAGRSEGPFFAESFGDNVQEDKDEIFFGVTYQF
jgi:hypothetical protein